MKLVQHAIFIIVIMLDIFLFCNTNETILRDYKLLLAKNIFLINIPALLIIILNKVTDAQNTERAKIILKTLAAIINIGLLIYLYAIGFLMYVGFMMFR